MHVLEIDVDEHRHPENPVHELLYHRWSPRAMAGEALSDADVSSLFEAARWAPSSFNGQPWRFYYARRDGEHWPLFFNWLVEFNQSWAQHAGLLAVVTSNTLFEHNGAPCLTHGFDAGAAWQNLALQGRSMGLVVHAMGGFDAEAARAGLGVPEDVAIHAMVAVGRPAPANVLPEGLRDQEAPNQRKPIDEIAFDGLHR